MKQGTKAYLFKEGGKVVSDLLRLRLTKPRKPSTSPEAEKEASPEEKTMITTQEPAKPPRIPSESEAVVEEIAIACVPCALGHFSTTAGLLTEAVRFKGEGIISNEVVDRVALALIELNTLERVDLTPEKILSAPEWERKIAEEALKQSRSLRHHLEAIKTIEELEQIAANTVGYYRNLNREWWRGRLAKPELTLDEAKKLAADEAAREVEKRWTGKKSTT